MSDGVEPSPPSARSKVKPRPARLKTPLDQVLSSAGGATSSRHHRPIGTPPPTSLRKSASVCEAGGGQGSSASSSSSDHFGFPNISVEIECPEGAADHDPEWAAQPPPPPPATDNRRGSLMSLENNNGGGGGLSPPTRLVTRDQDGVVFEVAGGQEAGPH